MIIILSTQIDCIPGTQVHDFLPSQLKANPKHALPEANYAVLHDGSGAGRVIKARRPMPQVGNLTAIVQQMVELDVPQDVPAGTSPQVLNVIPPDEQSKYSEPKVMSSAAGYYIGTEYDDEGITMPGSRDSDYFPTREAAQKALDSGEFTQRMTP